MNRRTVTRLLLRGGLLQAGVYATLAYFGPCRPAPPPAPEGPLANRRRVLDWLPIKRSDLIEQLLAGWEKRRLPEQDAVFGWKFAREHPRSYIVEYRRTDREAIWVMYSAGSDEQIAIRYSDQ